MKIITNILELTQLIGAALIFASRDPDSERIYGVQFERCNDELLAISSDRFRLGVTSINTEYTDVPDAWSTFVPFDELSRLRTTLRSFGMGKKRNELSATLTHTDNALTVDLPGQQVTLRTVTGDFPDWRALIAFESEHGAPQFNPHYLTDFSKAELYRGKEDRMHINLGGNSRPTRITIGDYFVGVIMPLASKPTTTLYDRLKGTQ